jgi:hypothetical protein
MSVNHKKFTNSLINAGLASSLVDCPPATQATRVRSSAETCLSQGAYLEDGENLVKFLHNILVYSPSQLVP